MFKKLQRRNSSTYRAHARLSLTNSCNKAARLAQKMTISAVSSVQFVSDLSINYAKNKVAPRLSLKNANF